MSIVKELIKYSDDVLVDKPMLTCQKHKWACQRFLNDLERQDSEDFPFIFNEDKANDILKWMGLFKHHQGILAGQVIKPDIIQKFILGNVYGWQDINTGYRRFSKMYWQVARKNAKSQTLAAVGLYELMVLSAVQNETMEVYVVATKKDQANIIYDEARTMLINSDAFKNTTKYAIANKRITHSKTGSIMRALSKEDRKTGDGLHPSCGLIDEFHAHVDADGYNVVDSGMGNRPNPLMSIVTTAGFDLNNPCYKTEYNLVSKILNPENPVILDEYFVMINELDKDLEGNLIDSIHDEKAWSKANPIVCTYPAGVNYIRKKQKEALLAPDKMRNYLTKHMNVWVMMKEAGYMLVSKWDQCKCEGEFPALEKESCWIGFDLSAKIDLTSLGFVFNIDGKIHVVSKSFMPEETIDQKSKTDKVPYLQWIEDGWIIPTPGAVTDYKFVMEWGLNFAKENKWTIEGWPGDPWMAEQMNSDLVDLGQTPIEVRQGPKTLSEPTKDFRDQVYKKNVIHDGSPVLRWAVGNAVIDTLDRTDNIMLNKGKSTERIDPIAAVINAHVHAKLGPVMSYNNMTFRSLA